MKSKKPHYFADLVFANTVIANELGFGGPIEYLKSHGWMYIVKKGGTKTLQYKSLSNTIFQTVPLGCVATHGIHFKAMIKKLYEIIKGNGIKDVYKGMDMVHFLQEDRFCQRLHLYTQEFQFGVLFVEKFFLPHVKSNIGDTVFWMKKDNTKTILSLSTTSSPSFWMVVTPNSQLTSWQRHQGLTTLLAFSHMQPSDHGVMQPCSHGTVVTSLWRREILLPCCQVVGRESSPAREGSQGASMMWLSPVPPGRAL